jgi:C-terminal processing protease CtpA/Prc
MLADLWGKLYLFHPRLASSTVDWNRVLLDSIPKVESAANPNELVAALNDVLFQPLNDPFLEAQRRDASTLIGAPRELSARRLSDTVGYLDATDPRGYGRDSMAAVRKALGGIGAIHTLVVDLRFIAPLPESLDWLRLFLREPVVDPHYLFREHRGWGEDDPSAQNWKVRSWSRYTAFDSIGVRRPLAVFLVNRSSYERCSTLLDALQAEGNYVVFERLGRFASVVEHYPEDVDVHLPTFNLLSKLGVVGALPDYVSTIAIPGVELVSLAGRLAQQRASAAHERLFDFKMTFAPADHTFRTTVSREERLLGLFKIWIVVSYLDLNLKYASLDWPTALRTWIPKVEAAQNVPEYYAVLRELAAYLNDSHVVVFPPSEQSQVTLTVLPLRLRAIEGKPVVVGVLKPPSGEPVPVSVGDEIVAVGGRSVNQIFEERRRLISASTPGALLRQLIASLGVAMRGQEAAPWASGPGLDSVELTLQSETGRRTVSVKTMLSTPPSPSAAVVSGYDWQSGPPYKSLEAGLAYIDMRSLTEEDLKAISPSLMSTKGLIVDMRGYPRSAVSRSLISTLMDRPVQSALADVPIAVPEKNRKITEEIFSWIEPAPAPYTKPVVVMIDSRAQSASEDFCIPLRNTKRATFVGSTTAGTDGGVTRIWLPAGGSMQFTGSQVKYGDGSRFENVGIVPDVWVEPTIAGVRAGRDEVLEKAIAVIRSLL